MGAVSAPALAMRKALPGTVTSGFGSSAAMLTADAVMDYWLVSMKMESAISRVQRCEAPEE